MSVAVAERVLLLLGAAVALAMTSGCSLMTPGPMLTGPVHPERPEAGEMGLQGQAGIGIGSFGGSGDGVVGGALRSGVGLGKRFELVSGFQGGCGLAASGVAGLSGSLGLRWTTGQVTLGAGFNGGVLLSKEFTEESLVPYMENHGWAGPDVEFIVATRTPKGFFSLAQQVGLSFPFDGPAISSPQDLDGLILRWADELRTTFTYTIEPAVGWSIGATELFTISPVFGVTLEEPGQGTVSIYAGMTLGVMVRPR